MEDEGVHHGLLRDFVEITAGKFLYRTARGHILAYKIVPHAGRAVTFLNGSIL